MLKQLFSHLTKRRKKQFWLVLFLMILAYLSEVISLGAVLPFLGILTAPEMVYQHNLMQPFIVALKITEASQLILPLTVIFIFLVVLAGLIRLLLLYAMTKISFATGADLSIEIYRRTLYQEYSIHLARNSSEVINGIITKTNIVISQILLPILTLISSIILLIGILTALFLINTSVALSASFGFGFLYWGVIRFTKVKLEENSYIIAEQSTKMVKSLQEGLGGIRDVLIDSSQEFYCKLYQNADFPLRKASGVNQFISNSPRFIMEAIGMTLIAIIAYVMTTHQEGGISTAIPVLGALALGAQRLLPALQQSYSSYSSIKGSKSSFEDVLNLLDQPLPDYANKPIPLAIKFKNQILLNNISFRYSKEDSWIFKGLNLKITKGSRTGFVGETGSGKSTLLDIIMGLLHSSEGEMLVDDEIIDYKNKKSWQANIAHVPQNIYLSDNTIEENIAFGIPKSQIDHQLVKESAQQAQIDELITEWKNGYKTNVGEQGVRLSGGQRQRIGIARALYKKANVLIFDEATSSLDNKTEQAVMDEIKILGRDLTILIIAHRLTTLKVCDQIVSLNKNNDIQIGSYTDLINEQIQ